MKNESEIVRRRVGISAEELADDSKLEERLRNTIQTNLNKLLRAANMTQRQLSELLGIATGTLNGYVKGSALPGIAVIVKLCSLKEFERFNLSVESFVMGFIDFDKMEREAAPPVPEDRRPVPEGSEHTRYLDHVGNYYCYIYNRYNAEEGDIYHSEAPLRCGVVSIFEQQETVRTRFRVLARFFDGESDGDAHEFKKKLDGVFERTQNVDVNLRATEVQSYYNKEQFYFTGELNLTPAHAYIGIDSMYYGDRAMMVFNMPGKKSGTKYVGGMGGVVSVSHGKKHEPVLQRIIISRYRLAASDEEIVKLLRFGSATVGVTEECETLINMIRQMYSPKKDDEKNNDFLDDEDKRVVFIHRFVRMLEQCVERNSMCANWISAEDDALVYQLIKRSRAYREDDERASVVWELGRKA